MSKQTELLSKMKELQQEYAKHAAELKALKEEDEQKQFQERQLSRLEAYKAKYKYFVSGDGSVKEINFEEVEKLIRSSFGQKSGYALGFDSSGMEGLGYDSGATSGHGDAGYFTPMVEDETEAKRYVEREARRQEWLKNYKGKNA
jgi:hypothetical protein